MARNLRKQINGFIRCGCLFLNTLVFKYSKVVLIEYLNVGNLQMWELCAPAGYRMSWSGFACAYRELHMLIRRVVQPLGIACTRHAVVRNGPIGYCMCHLL